VVCTVYCVCGVVMSIILQYILHTAYCYCYDGMLSHTIKQTTTTIITQGLVKQLHSTHTQRRVSSLLHIEQPQRQTLGLEPEQLAIEQFATES